MLEVVRAYVVNLTEISGEGQFKCPKCKALISPDDTSEKVYTILEAVMNKDIVDRIVLQCNKCGSQIIVIGFQNYAV